MGFILLEYEAYVREALGAVLLAENIIELFSLFAVVHETS